MSSLEQKVKKKILYINNVFKPIIKGLNALYYIYIINALNDSVKL